MNLPSQTMESARRRAEDQRINEVARVANDLQRQGLTRSEALRVAEKFIPHRS